MCESKFRAFWAGFGFRFRARKWEFGFGFKEKRVNSDSDSYTDSKSNRAFYSDSRKKGWILIQLDSDSRCLDSDSRCLYLHITWANLPFEAAQNVPIFSSEPPNRCYQTYIIPILYDHKNGKQSITSQWYTCQADWYDVNVGGMLQKGNNKDNISCYSHVEIALRHTRHIDDIEMAMLHKWQPLFDVQFSCRDWCYMRFGWHLCPHIAVYK